jgi:hypothetical protein
MACRSLILNKASPLPLHEFVPRSTYYSRPREDDHLSPRKPDEQDVGKYRTHRAENEGL